MAPHWTDADIPDLTGKTALVTGANSGIGLHESLQLARHGAQVFVAARNGDKGRAAIEMLREHVPADRVELVPLDLADLDSVRRLAGELAGRLEHLDLLVNNAGVMAVPSRQTTTQGFELQFGTNHLGHFALTGLLLPLLLAATDSRVVTVSSVMHKVGRIDLDDLQSERAYGPQRAYGAAKLANAVFTLELDRRLRAVGASTLSVGAHPGFSHTNLQNTGTGFVARMSALVTPVFAQSAARGALPVLRAAVDPLAHGGDYYGPHGVAEMWGYPVKVPYTRTAHDAELGKALWAASVDLTSVDYAELAEAA
ncbi:MAG: SDR family oxidoreductase [Kutzneria sp.]|nr:SDR family oxidoreductase [Kutzneria sp.]